MGYKYYNPNPSGNLVGDCVIRAVSKALDRSWEEVYVKICLQGLMMHDMPSSNSVWGSFLYAQNFRRHAIPDMCPDCYTVEEFAADNQVGTFVLWKRSRHNCPLDSRGGALGFRAPSFSKDEEVDLCIFRGKF